MYIHDSVAYNVLPYGSADLELLAVSLSRNNFQLCLCVFYRPPSSPSSIFDTLCETLLSVPHSYFSNFVILGDFNVNFDVSHHFYTHLSDFMTSFSLSQVVTSPTHFSHCGHPSLIDLVFVSNLSHFSTCSIIPQLANSDHLGLCVTMRCQHMSYYPTCRRQVWRYKHANFERANELLCDIEIEDIIDPYNIQDSWSCFKTTFLDIMEQCIPRAILPCRKNLPWMNKEIIQLIRKRNLYFRKAHRSGNDGDRMIFKKLRNTVVAKLRHNKKAFFVRMHPHSQKEFWKLVKILNPKGNTLPTLVTATTTATSNLDKANLLNSAFMKNFNYSVPGLLTDDSFNIVPHTCPSDLLCTEDEVYGLLSTLDVTKANGHDDISAIMLKETAVSITPVITKLFNASIWFGEIPDEWKVARITPIPKGGNASDPGNYRSISLLSILSKLLEKHVQNLLVKHFEEHCPLSVQQWGFTPGKSTTGALLAATNHWFSLLDQGYDICAVFFDYSKAFDMVPHSILLQKLRSYNVNPHILRWLANYLSSRLQYVCVNGASSNTLPVSSGVPQGSILGPLLFIIYINDISTVPLSAGSMLLYADDSMLYHPINGPEDYHHLQEDINRLCTWTNDNFLKYNSNKCKYMVISRKKQSLVPCTPLRVNQIAMEAVGS